MFLILQLRNIPGSRLSVRALEHAFDLSAFDFALENLKFYFMEMENWILIIEMMKFNIANKIVSDFGRANTQEPVFISFKCQTML